jgi:hypothetical protein
VRSAVTTAHRLSASGPSPRSYRRLSLTGAGTLAEGGGGLTRPASPERPAPTDERPCEEPDGAGCGRQPQDVVNLGGVTPRRVRPIREKKNEGHPGGIRVGTVGESIPVAGTLAEGRRRARGSRGGRRRVLRPPPLPYSRERLILGSREWDSTLLLSLCSASANQPNGGRSFPPLSPSLW